MKRLMSIAAIVLVPSVCIAESKTPSGTFLGHDGKLWRMEGCAAYPVEPQAGAQSKPVASAPVKDETPAELAETKKPAE